MANGNRGARPLVLKMAWCGSLRTESNNWRTADGGRPQSPLGTGSRITAASVAVSSVHSPFHCQPEPLLDFMIPTNTQCLGKIGVDAYSQMGSE